MEKEAGAIATKTCHEMKGDGATEEAVSRGDSIKPSEPKERAKVPDKDSNHFVSESRLEVSTGENSCYDDIQRSVQQLIDDINAKRKRDTDLLNDLKKALEEQINTSCSVLEDSIVHTYEKHSKSIQDKLQELFAVLERISKLEGELMDFKRALGALYNDMQGV